jgi:hypothetical protein
LAAFVLSYGNAAIVSAAEKDSPGLTATWSNNYLTIKGPGLPKDGIRTHYLEAFCRPGSTDREWGKTVIPHRTQLVSASDDGRTIKLRSELADGVIVSHVITVGSDELDFRLVATNPTKKDSLVDWAQPCTRVGNFTGDGAADARVLHPKYIRKCFIYLDGRLTRLPTKPWAEKARYIPGQVYVPKGVNRNDVNPRPLSKLVPSSGLTGCYSADEKLMLGIAWEPYQEIFQGVIACMHSDFRIGGLKAGQTKKIHGKMYIVPADAEKLRKRYEKDFPEQK